MPFPLNYPALVWMTALALASAAAGAQVGFVDRTMQAIPLAAGSSTTVVFQLRNTGPNTAMAELSAGFHLPLDPAEHTLAAASGCPLPPRFNPVALSLAAGETRECRYTLARAAGSSSDNRVYFGLQQAGQTGQGKTFRFGDLARLQLTQVIERPAAPGVPGRVRINVHNGGPTPVGSLKYGTCVQGIASANLPRVVGGDCSANGGGLCFSTDGIVGVGFTVGNIAAGASRSCVIEWQPAPGANPLILQQLSLVKMGSGFLESSDPAADSFELQVRQLSGAQQLPLLGWPAVLLLLGGMVIVVARRR